MFSAEIEAASFFQVVAIQPIAIIHAIMQEKYTPFQPKLLLMYAAPVLDNIAPKYPHIPVKPHAAETDSCTVTRDACTPPAKFCGPSTKKPINEASKDVQKNWSVPATQ